MKFYDVLNPNKMSSYVSEIMDAGVLGPWFKVLSTYKISCLFSNVVFSFSRILA